MPGGSISFDPNQFKANNPPPPPPGGQPPVNYGETESGPYNPNFMTQAGNTVQQLIGSAQQSAGDQKGRLMDFINNLWRVRDHVMMQAKGAAARGANGQQNPLDVYQAVNEAANQAGIPLETQISQALLQGNNIENVMNDLISKAASTYTQLASIPQSHSQSGGGGNGGVMSLGGPQNRGNNGQGPAKGIYTDIRGNQTPSRPGEGTLDQWIAQENARKAAEANTNSQGFINNDVSNRVKDIYGNPMQWNSPSVANQSPYSGNYGSGSGFNDYGFGNGPTGGLPNSLTYNPNTQNASYGDGFGQGGAMRPGGGYNFDQILSQGDNYQWNYGGDQPFSPYVQESSGFQPDAGWSGPQESNQEPLDLGGFSPSMSYNQQPDSYRGYSAPESQGDIGALFSSWFN